MHLRSLFTIICFIGFMAMGSAPMANTALFPINFMRGDNDRIIQINMVVLAKRPMLSDKGFFWEVLNRGLVLTDFETGGIIAKFEPKGWTTGSSQFYGTYALDNNRLVIPLGFDVGVWNFKTNEFTRYKDKGSGASGYGIQISGVSPAEDIILACNHYLRDQTFYKNLRNMHKALIFYNLRKGTVTLLFHDYEVSSPLFSPDGTRYAFYGILNNHTRDEKHYMIIHALSSGETYTYTEDRELHGSAFTELMWSPTGKYLAGIGPTGFAQHSLHIWNNTGKLLARIPLQFSPESGWLPVWSHDEKSVVLFYYDDRTKKDHKILRQEFELGSYGL